MSFVQEKEGFWRKVGLAGFVLAMLGPWSFDLIHVPAQFMCENAVRLAGDFCGFPVSGIGGVIMVLVSLFGNLGALIRGNVVFLLPELTALFIMSLVIVPSISTVMLILKERPLGFRVMNLIFWVLGALAAGLMLTMQTGRPQVAPVIHLVWGAWFYILVTVGAVALEGMRLRTNITKN